MARLFSFIEFVVVVFSLGIFFAIGICMFLGYFILDILADPVERQEAIRENSNELHRIFQDFYREILAARSKLT